MADNLSSSVNVNSVWNRFIAGEIILYTLRCAKQQNVIAGNNIIMNGVIKMNKHRSNDEAECIAGMLHGQPIDAKGLSLNEMLAKSPELVSMTMEELGLDMQCSIGSLVEEYFDGSLDACEFSEKMLRLGSFDEVIVNIIEFAKIFDPLMTETLLEDCLYEQQKISVIMGFLRALDVNFDDGDDSVTIDR